MPNLLYLCLCTYALKIDNNQITNIQSLCKCNFPFLSELILDSNCLLEMPSLFMAFLPHLQKIQFRNCYNIQIIIQLSHSWTYSNASGCPSKRSSSITLGSRSKDAETLSRISSCESSRMYEGNPLRTEIHLRKTLRDLFIHYIYLL